MPIYINGIMTIDENGNSAIEGSIDPNCPVFARLNLEFTQASWTAAQHVVRQLFGKKDSSLNLIPVPFLVALGSDAAQPAKHANSALRSSQLGLANCFS